MSNAKTAAHEVLYIIPLVMRSVASELRRVENLPSEAHFGVLFELTQGNHNLSELAEKLNVSLPTMSNSISSLVDHGYVRRTRAAHDRRHVVIGLTESGLELLKTMETLAETMIAKELAETSAEEIETLIEGLRILRSAFSPTIDQIYVHNEGQNKEAT